MEADGCTCILSLRLVEVEERSVLPDERIRGHERVLEALDLSKEACIWILAISLS